MKINIDLKKGTEAVSGAIQKTSDISKKVSANLQEKAKDLSEKAKNDSYLRRMKKYNPLFSEKFFGEDFNKPNMIVIVDDAVRRGIDVCEGAIGWLNNENGVEVMYLYDEFVANSGISFVPAVTCDTAYYVDKFDRNKFIQVESIFGKAHEERLAELKHIAYSLGAKHCSIEITESSSESEFDKQSLSLNAKPKGLDAPVKVGFSESLAQKGLTQRSGKIEVEFEKSTNIVIPTLKWFANDEIIKNLIEMRCSSNNTIKSETLVLEGSMSSTMSKKAAYAADCALSKIKIGAKAELEKQAVKENRSKLIFVVEF